VTEYRRKGSAEAEEWQPGREVFGLRASPETPDKIVFRAPTGQDVEIGPGDFVLKDRQGNLMPVGKKLFENLWEPVDLVGGKGVREVSRASLASFPAVEKIREQWSGALPKDLLSAVAHASRRESHARPTCHKRARESWSLPRSRAVVADFRRLSFLDIDADADADQHNPSVTLHRGSTLANIRVLRRGRTENHLAPLDLVSCKLGQRRELATPAAWEGTSFEDLRLFSWKGELWALAAAVGGMLSDGKICQVLLRLGRDADRVESVKLLPTPWAEKNWMPCVDSAGRMRIVYSVEPLVVLDVDGGAFLDLPTERVVPGGHLRGGSQLLARGSGFLSVVHEQFLRAADKPVYLHRFAAFDAHLTRVRLGPHFHFFSPDVEFAAGIADSKNHPGGVVVSFGVSDRESWLADISEDALLPLHPEDFG
jgi:hypothetical protein